MWLSGFNGFSSVPVNHNILGERNRLFAESHLQTMLVTYLMDLMHRLFPVEWDAQPCPILQIFTLIHASTF